MKWYHGGGPVLYTHKLFIYADVYKLKILPISITLQVSYKQKQQMGIFHNTRGIPTFENSVTLKLHIKYML